MLARPWQARRWCSASPSAGRPWRGPRRRMPAPDVVLVGTSATSTSTWPDCSFARLPVVLDHLTGASDTARDRRLSGALRRLLLKRSTRAALRAADVIVVDTEEHLARLPAGIGTRAVAVPVGAPSAWQLAAAGPPRADARRAAAGGVLRPVHPPARGAGHRCGAEPAGRGTHRGHDDRRRPGQGRDHGGRGQRHDRVRWLDWVPADELPALVAGHDVCLGIFGTGDKALRVVPNKVFQGAAAGCAIVTSDTAPQRRALSGASVLVPPGDPDALAAALLQLAVTAASWPGCASGHASWRRSNSHPERIVRPLARPGSPWPQHRRRARSPAGEPGPAPGSPESGARQPTSSGGAACAQCLAALRADQADGTHRYQRRA